MSSKLAVFMLDGRYGLLAGDALCLPAIYDAIWWIVPGEWAGLRRGTYFGWLRQDELTPTTLPACFPGLRRLGPAEMPAGRTPSEWLRCFPILFRHRNQSNLYVPELLWAEQVWAGLRLGKNIVLTDAETILFVAPDGHQRRISAGVMPGLFANLRDRVFVRETSDSAWQSAQGLDFEELTPASPTRVLSAAPLGALRPDELPRYYSALGELMYTSGLRPAGPPWPPVHYFEPRRLPRQVLRQCRRHFRCHANLDGHGKLPPVLHDHLLYTAWLLANDYVRFAPDGLAWVDARQPYRYALNIELTGTTLAELITLCQLHTLRPVLRGFLY